MRSKVLIIDDDLHCIEAYKMIFSNVEYEVEYFINPDEALEVFSKSPLLYALAFVDHQYRQGDEVKKWGEQIVKQIKKLNPTITSCIISGDETLESLRSWLSADVDHYIYKPLRKMEVLAFSKHHVLGYENNFLPMEVSEEGTYQEKCKDKMSKMGGHRSIFSHDRMYTKCLKIF